MDPLKFQRNGKAYKITKEQIFEGLAKKLDSITYYVSVKQDKNQRKEVLHDGQQAQRSTARGARNATTRKLDKMTNADVKESLDKEYGFDIFKDAFDRGKNPNSKLKNLAPFMLTQTQQDQTRTGNGLVAIVKNYMDRQTWKHNKEQAIQIKGFDKFGIDSGQLQQSIGWNVSFRRGGK